MRTKRTRAQVHARAMARKMLKDPYYRELRSWHFGLNAKEAMEAVKAYDALIEDIERIKPFTALEERLARGERE